MCTRLSFLMKMIRKPNVKSMKSNTEYNSRLNYSCGFNFFFFFFNNENCLFKNRTCQIYTYKWYLDDIHVQARSNCGSSLSIIRFAIRGSMSKQEVITGDHFK